MRFIFSSEVGERDGMAVEMWTDVGSEGVMLGEVFRDDLVEPPTYTLKLSRPIALEHVRSLIAEADRRFPEARTEDA